MDWVLINECCSRAENHVCLIWGIEYKQRALMMFEAALDIKQVVKKQTGCRSPFSLPSPSTFIHIYCTLIVISSFIFVFTSFYSIKKNSSKSDRRKGSKTVNAANAKLTSLTPTTRFSTNRNYTSKRAFFCLLSLSVSLTVRLEVFSNTPRKSSACRSSHRLVIFLLL